MLMQVYNPRSLAFVLSSPVFALSICVQAQTLPTNTARDNSVGSAKGTGIATPMPVDTLTSQQLTAVTPACVSKPQAQHEFDEHALAAMSMYDHPQGTTLLAPTPRALSFPTHAILDISLDGPTPRAFAFPSSVHETVSNGSINPGPPMTPPEPSPSTPSTSSSPFEPDQQQQHQNGFQTQGQQPVPSIARRSQSVQRARADTSSPAAQISSFNAPDPNPGQPLTLAARRRGSSISSLMLPSHSSHTLSFSQSQPGPQVQQQQQQPPPLPPNPHAHAIQLAGTERRPKRGDEDYIKRPENAFILFRRECCLKRNEAEAAAAQEGDPVTRRQRQADLSKTISQQWRSLSAEERKYWDDLAKQRKKEHEEMYPWYVYQPTRSDRKKKKTDGGAGETTEGGKAKKGKGTKKERRERERAKSSSRVRGTGSRARNSSTCSSLSLASTTSMSSSASTVDSEDFSELDSVSADSSLYGPFGYPNGNCDSVREVEAADLHDYEMSESEGLQSQPLSLPFSLSMPSLVNGSGAAQGVGLAIDTRNALASFSLESGPFATSQYSHSHHGSHGRGHGHSLSAQIPTQTIQNLGPLNFVLPQGRRSTSAPGDPQPSNMPADLYQTPPTIKIPQLLDTNNDSKSNSAVGSPVAQEANANEQQNVQVNGQSQAQGEGQFNGVNNFQFPHVQPQQIGFGMSGQVPDFASAGNEVQHNGMFRVYEEPLTAKPRPRALSQITIPHEPSTNQGPLSAPVPATDASASSSRMFLPDQFIAMSNGQLQVPQRAIPQGIPESPEASAGNEWDDYGLPPWAMSTFSDEDAAALQQQRQQQAVQHNSQQGQEQGQGQGQQETHSQNMFGEIGIGMDMNLPPWMGFPTMDPMNSMGAMNPMGCGMDAMATDGNGERHGVDPYATMHFQYDDLLNPSQL